jgi:hypothetical protein
MDAVFRFLQEIFAHIVVDFILHAPGYAIRRWIIERNKPNVELRDFASFIVSFLFWAAIVALLWKFG